MTKTAWTTMCSAIIGCATAAAMAQTPSPQSTTPSTDQKVTVTGCLVPAPASSAAPTPTGTAGTAGTTATAGTAGTTAAAGETAAAGQTFQLTNATAASADSPATAAGATPTASDPAAQTFRLIANPAALSPHIGKKLALTGTLEKQDGATASPESSSGSAPKTLALKVESGKVIAESCTQ